MNKNKDCDIAADCKINPYIYCYCIDGQCEHVDTASEVFNLKRANVIAMRENDLVLRTGSNGITDGMWVTKVKLYPMYDLNNVIIKYWMQYICDGEFCGEYEISNLYKREYSMFGGGSGNGSENYINNVLKVKHKKNHPDDQEIKSIIFLSFRCFNTHDIFSKIITSKNIYYYGPDLKSLRKSMERYDDDEEIGLTPYFKEMSEKEIKEYAEKNKMSNKLKDKEKQVKINKQWDGYLDEYEKMEDKNSVEVIFMNEIK